MGFETQGREGQNFISILTIFFRIIKDPLILEHDMLTSSHQIMNTCVGTYGKQIKYECMCTQLHTNCKQYRMKTIFFCNTKVFLQKQGDEIKNVNGYSNSLSINRDVLHVKVKF